MDPTIAGSRSLLYCKQYFQTFRVQTCKANYAGTRKLVGYLTLISVLCLFLLHLSECNHIVMRSQKDTHLKRLKYSIILSIMMTMQNNGKYPALDTSWLLCVAYDFLSYLPNLCIARLWFISWRRSRDCIFYLDGLLHLWFAWSSFWIIFQQKKKLCSSVGDLALMSSEAVGFHLCVKLHFHIIPHWHVPKLWESSACCKKLNGMTRPCRCMHLFVGKL